MEAGKHTGLPLRALTAWPAERWLGAFVSAAGLAAVIFGVGLFQEAVQWLTSLIIMVLAIAPMTALCLPLTLLLRWLAQQHEQALAQVGRARWQGMAVLVLIALGGGRAPRPTPHAPASPKAPPAP